MILGETKDGFMLSSFDHFNQQYKQRQLNPIFFTRALPPLKGPQSDAKKRSRGRPLNHNEKASLDFHLTCWPLLQAAYTSLRSSYKPLVGISFPQSGVPEPKRSDPIHLENKYVIPSNCQFLMSDITSIAPLVKDAEENGRYHFIVLDPPWENTSVERGREKKRRIKSETSQSAEAQLLKEGEGEQSGVEDITEEATASYSTLPPHILKTIPLDELVAENGIVCIWVTHKMQYINFIKKTLLPHWDLQYITTYYWLKLNSSGEPISDLADDRNRCYEVVIIAKKGELTGPLPAVPAIERVLLSDAGAVHSHKPPLDKVFVSYLPAAGRKLELFARNLNSGWTSWGNEVLALQHVKYFL